MKLELFLSKNFNLIAENKILKFFIVIIGMLQLMNAFWNYQLTKSYKTIIIPTGINEKMEVTNNSISDNGIKYYVRYILALTLNYTPAVARGQFEELLSLYSPEGYVQAKTDFYSLADTIEAAKVASLFYIQRITLDQGKNTIEVLGNKKQYVNETKIKDTSEVYFIEYSVDHGRFMINKIYSKEEKREN